MCTLFICRAVDARASSAYDVQKKQVVLQSEAGKIDNCQ